MGGLTESKRRTCRRNHCPPSDVWRAWLPSAHPCAAEPHWCRRSKIGWNAVRHTRTYQASHNHGDPQPMPAQRAMRPSRTVERRVACGLPVKSDARMRNRPMPAGGAESLKRQRLLDDLRTNAFAMPKATMKLLMALPLLTVLLGEGMGAHSLAFLVSGVKGLACLGFALCCYTFGLIWIRALMRQDDMKGAM